MDRRPTLSLNEWAVLGLLVEAPRHGYDIALELDAGTEVGEVWTVPRPLVYRALERLEALGLADARRREPGHGPRRTVYGATRRGRARLRRWLSSPVEHLRDLRSGLLLKLVVGRRLGVDPGSLLARQRETLTRPIARLARRPADPADVVALWRHHAARAAGAFLDDLDGVGAASAGR